jgi:hypothetical protein
MNVKSGGFRDANVAKHDVYGDGDNASNDARALALGDEMLLCTSKPNKHFSQR